MSISLSLSGKIAMWSASWNFMSPGISTLCNFKDLQITNRIKRDSHFCSQLLTINFEFESFEMLAWSFLVTFRDVSMRKAWHVWFFFSYYALDAMFGVCRMKNYLEHCDCGIKMMTVDSKACDMFTSCKPWVLYCDPLLHRNYNTLPECLFGSGVFLQS